MSSNAEDNNNEQHSGGREMISSKKECTSSEHSSVDNIAEDFDSVAILNDTSICACCGKNGNSSDMNTCNKCKEVKYCNAACKKKHRSKHKKICERRVAELHEEALYKEHPPNEECPICLIPLPTGRGRSFQSCCGKEICIGCIYAMNMSEGKDLCAFCRTPPAISDEEEIVRTEKLMKVGNAEAYYMLAGCYAQGIKGLSRDMNKANELLLKAGELGCAVAYFNLGNLYLVGNGVEVDKRKVKYYHELAAMMGFADARHNLGVLEAEGQAGNYDHACIERSMKHFILAARAGFEPSLGIVKGGFKGGMVTKEEFANTLRAYHERQKEMKSEMRDRAASSGNFSSGLGVL